MPRESGASSNPRASYVVPPRPKHDPVVTESPACAGDDGSGWCERRRTPVTIALPAARPAMRRLIPFDMSWPILLGVAAVLIVLVVLPMSWLVYFSVTDKAGAL